MNNTTRARKLREQYQDFTKYLNGAGVDIGAGNDCLVIPSGTVRPWDMKDGDASLLAGIPDGSFDFVYSSHCLEHLRDIELSLRNWIRVLKPGGFLYVAVPDYTIYEKLNWPSAFNGDHKHSFSLDLTRAKVRRNNHWHINQDLVPLIDALGMRIFEARLEDDGYDYNKGFVDQTFDDSALSQICLIGKKQ